MLPTALLATLATPLATAVLAPLVAALMVQAVHHSTTTSVHPLRVPTPPQHHTCLMDHFAMVHRSSPSATRQRDVH